MTASPGSPQDLAGAETYERLLVPGLFTPSTRRAVALARVGPGQHLLDLACGTGIGARLALAQTGPGMTAVGVDHDAAMVAVARRLAPAAHWLCADAHQLPLPDACFDVVLCLQGLQFMADRPAALREVHRVLRPGGRLVATAWAALDAMPGHAAVYAALDAQGIDTRSPRRGFALDIAVLRQDAQAAGFGAVHTGSAVDAAAFTSAGQFVQALLQGAPYTRRVLATLEPDRREACAQDAVRRLDRWTSDSGFVLPTCSQWLLAER